MNKEVKKKWVERLRSGRDRQAKYNLRSDDGFCCLGVLCEIAVEEGVIAPPTECDNGVWRYGMETTNPSLMVVAWAGLDDNSPTVPDDDTDVELTGLNDDYEWTFAQIADAIEEHL